MIVMRGQGGSGRWWVLDEPELHLGEDVVVPGLAGWRRERMPELPDTAYFTLAPDWVCEVLSSSTRRVDLHEKRSIYAREYVAHLWLIDLDIRPSEPARPATPSPRPATRTAPESSARCSLPRRD